MRRIAFVLQKGGVGKTSLSIHSACALSELGHKTLLVDLDPQGSILAWFEHAQNLPKALSVSRAESPADLDDVSGFRYVIIDTPGRLTSSVLAHCDTVVLPIVPGPLEVWAAADSVQLVKDHQAKNPALKAAIVVNRMQPNTKLSKEIFDVIKGYELPLFPKPIGQRTAYAQSLASGSYTLNDEIREFTKNLIKLSK